MINKFSKIKFEVINEFKKIDEKNKITYKMQIYDIL